MTAKEMFEELGFKRCESDIRELTVYLLITKFFEPVVRVSFYPHYVKTEIYEHAFVPPRMYLAIAEQMKELGWLNDDIWEKEEKATCISLETEHGKCT